MISESMIHLCEKYFCLNSEEMAGFGIKCILVVSAGWNEQSGYESVAGEPLKDTLPALRLWQQPPLAVNCAHVPLTESSPAGGSAWHGFSVDLLCTWKQFFLTLNGVTV